MNTGQVILAVGAMVLLSTILLRVNNTFLTSDEVLDQSKYSFLATSIATSIIEQSKNLSFDEQTLGDINIDNPSLLTPVVGLHYDSGEDPHDCNTFDDFDDFNNYTYTDSSMPSAVFVVTCRVDYVPENDPETVSGVPTFNKKITVTVSSPHYMSDVIQLSSVFSYWYFR
ncbi:MAG TPA: hypothetical protein VMT35_16990 [Ignavibacteriaceae bacterium]|nr:hypothetical protein [Ignavibacteriaceae bacterium]